MSSFDRVKLCELIGCLLLYNLNSITDPCNHGFYGDDGLVIEDDCTPRKGNIIRKKSHWLFNKFESKLDIYTNLKITDYLDITINLYAGSNHFRHIFKYVPNGIMFRFSTNFSNIDIFTQNKCDYEMALKNSCSKTKLVYETMDETVDVHNRKNSRARKILWFMLQYGHS